jgi:hypothetical protein
MPRTIKLDIYDLQGRKQEDLLYQRRSGLDSYRELKKFLKIIGALSSSSHKSGRIDRRLLSSSSGQQQCMVKLRYGNDMTTHMRFLQEYLSQKNKEQVTEKPELFNDEKDIEDTFIENYKNNMTGLHYKFIISPESQEADIEALVKTLVKKMESVTGYRFYWMAAVHRDTGHNHAHLLINGCDKNNREVDFDKTFKTNTIREMTKSICTSLVGHRFSQEIKNSIEKSYLKHRYTVLDEAIQEQEIPIENEIVYGSAVSTFDDLLLKRLTFLSGLNLAAPVKDRKNTIILRRAGKQNLKLWEDIILFLMPVTVLKEFCSVNLELFTKDTGLIEGTITKLYRMNDEENWNHAILVENKKLNKAWYIRLHFEPKDELLNARIKCGYKFNAKGNLVPKLTVIKWNDFAQRI